MDALGPVRTGDARARALRSTRVRTSIALPGSTLATTNLMSLFGMHRRLRGALVGHLAAFEMTSCIPNRRYGDGLRRLGFGPEVTAYFDEHVEADAAHGAIAANDMAGSLVHEEPDLSADVLFGAAALLGLDGRVASRLIDAWSGGTSSFYGLPVARAARLSRSPVRRGPRPHARRHTGVWSVTVRTGREARRCGERRPRGRLRRRW